MKRILVIDDDKVFCDAVVDNFTRRGFDARSVQTKGTIFAAAADFQPEWVLLDLKMPGLSGLTIIPELLALNLAVRIVVLTGYASIATAVEAIKLGAVHYLTKPVPTDDIIAAFQKETGDAALPIDQEPADLNKAERKHIFSVLQRNRNNISATARDLGMDRRTLQRKLQKIK